MQGRSTADIQQQLQNPNKEIISREKDIQQLAKGVVEIHDLMGHVSTLVKDQQTLVDNIEFNINLSKTNTHAAKNELKQAAESQENTTCKII